MNAPHETPAQFGHFSDAQEFLARHAGGKPEDYFRDGKRTLEVARELGIESQVAAAIEASREMDDVIRASVQRAERATTRREPEGPPPIDFPPGAETMKPHGAPLPGFTLAHIWESIDPLPYLVRLLLIRGGLTVLFGLSGHLKTALAVAIASCVGTGTAFFGLKTHQRAGVLYVAGEGHAGLRKRFRAWLIEHGFDATSQQPSVYVTAASASLLGAPDQLRATVETAAAALGVPIELIVIDTLAANFGPGDEYHPRDMQQAIAAARDAAPGAAVLFVHHTGHGDTDRERGSYALIGAADFRVQAVYDEAMKVLELRWRKVKDDDAPESLLFAPKVIELGCEDEDGNELTSITLEPLKGPRPLAAGPAPLGLGKNQGEALKILRNLLTKARKNLEARGDDPAAACILTVGWQTACNDKGIDRRRFPEVRDGLIERGLIRIDGPHVILIEVTP